MKITYSCTISGSSIQYEADQTMLLNRVDAGHLVG